jgi:hypothetical protein
MPKYTIEMDGLKEIRPFKDIVGGPYAHDRDSLDDYVEVDPDA